MVDIDYLGSLAYGWTALVQLGNGQKITIWYTAFPMSKRDIVKVLNVSTDYPKNKIK